MAKWNGSEKSWERQPKESPQAYEAFSTYLSMGAERSCRKVAQKLYKSDTIIRRWSSAWNWQQRSRDYDNDLKRQEFAEAKKAAKDMQKRQTQTAMLMQKKAVQALDKLDIEDLTPRDILRFISIGAELERKNRQESTSEAAQESTGGSATSSLADTIISAYKKRMEDGEC